MNDVQKARVHDAFVDACDAHTVDACDVQSFMLHIAHALFDDDDIDTFMMSLCDENIVAQAIENATRLCDKTDVALMWRE